MDDGAHRVPGSADSAAATERGAAARAPTLLLGLLPPAGRGLVHLAHQVEENLGQGE